MKRITRREAIHIAKQLLDTNLKVKRFVDGINVVYQLRDTIFALENRQNIISLVTIQGNQVPITQYTFNPPYQKRIFPSFILEEVNEIVAAFQQRCEKEYANR